MQIILETPLEGVIWDIMVAAHYKWEKNHGDTLHDQMDCYFHDLFKEEVERAKKAEAQRRARRDFPEVFLSDQEKEERIKAAHNEGEATLEKLQEEFTLLAEEGKEMEQDLLECELDEESTCWFTPS